MAGDRKSIKGAPGYEIDAQCNVYQVGDTQKLDLDWPYVVLDTEDGRVRVTVPRAAADAFVPFQEQIRVFEEAVGARGKNDRRVRALAQMLGVSPWVILELVREDEREAFQPVEPETGDEPDRDVHEMPWTDFEAYPSPQLLEHHRPPSRGGNTRALHRHVIVIGGDSYSWRAVGQKKWAYVRDQVTFRYTISPEGYRNILVSTFRARDAAGQEQVRGDRSFKQQLRTSPSSP